MTGAASVVAPRGRGGLFWALVPVVLLGAGVAGVVTLALVATHDPGFALERDYYARAVRFDQQQAQWAENERLAYRLRPELVAGTGGMVLFLRVADRAGAPVRGARVTVEAFANARAADRRMLDLAEQEDGSYRVPLGVARPGLWELRFTVVRGADRFTEVARLTVPRGSER